MKQLGSLRVALTCIYHNDAPRAKVGTLRDGDQMDIDTLIDLIGWPDSVSINGSLFTYTKRHPDGWEVGITGTVLADQ